MLEGLFNLYNWQPTLHCTQDHRGCHVGGPRHHYTGPLVTISVSIAATPPAGAVSPCICPCIVGTFTSSRWSLQP